MIFFFSPISSYLPMFQKRNRSTCICIKGPFILEKTPIGFQRTLHCFYECFNFIIPIHLKSKAAIIYMEATVLTLSAWYMSLMTFQENPSRLLLTITNSSLFFHSKVELHVPMVSRIGCRLSSGGLLPESFPEKRKINDNGN